MTGVQTCALPIYSFAAKAANVSANEHACGILAAVLPGDELPPRMVGPPPDDGGKAEALDHELSSGVTHSRLIKDAQGRPIRKILYASGRWWRGPLEPGKLVEWGTETMTYDSAGRLAVGAQYDAARSLIWFVQHEYWADGKKRLGVWRTAEGVRTQEIRYPRDYPADIIKRGPIPELHFDRQTGQRLLYMSGPIPDDHELADGWGEAVGALRCGITVAGGTVECTIANISDKPSQLAHDTDGRIIRLELNDASGKAVLYHKRPGLSKIRHPGPATLRPRHAAYEHYLLGHWFGELQPGKYMARVVRRSTGGKFDLVSNTVVVEVPTPAEAAAEAQVRAKELVAKLTNDDVKWDGNHISLCVTLGYPARNVLALGRPALGELRAALQDKSKFAAAHVLMTMIAEPNFLIDTAAEWNGLRVTLTADGRTVLYPEQIPMLTRQWREARDGSLLTDRLAEHRLMTGVSLRGLPKDWVRFGRRAGTVEPLHWEPGKGVELRWQRKGYKPVDGKFGKGGEVHLWIMDANYAPKQDRFANIDPYPAQVGPAAETAAWRGRRVFFWGGGDDWPTAKADLLAVLKATDAPPVLTQPATQPATKAAFEQKVRRLAAQLSDKRFRVREAATKELIGMKHQG